MPTVTASATGTYHQLALGCKCWCTQIDRTRYYKAITIYRRLIFDSEPEASFQRLSLTCHWQKFSKFWWSYKLFSWSKVNEYILRSWSSRFNGKFTIIWCYRLNLLFLTGNLRIDMIISVQPEVPYLVQEILGHRECIGSSSRSDSSESLGWCQVEPSTSSIIRRVHRWGSPFSRENYKNSFRIWLSLFYRSRQLHWHLQTRISYWKDVRPFFPLDHATYNWIYVGRVKPSKPCMAFMFSPLASRLEFDTIFHGSMTR